jgi:hypothetical protein
VSGGVELGEECPVRGVDRGAEAGVGGGTRGRLRRGRQAIGEGGEGAPCDRGERRAAVDEAGGKRDAEVAAT